MREIKFRAWWYFNSQSPRMMYKMDKIANFSDSELYVYDTSNDEEFPIIMQYTGLKDKNWKEIYDGDVLKNLSYWSWCFVLNREDWSTEPFWLPYYARWDDYEIIGNKRENPDLLTKK